MYTRTLFFFLVSRISFYKIIFLSTSVIFLFSRLNDIVLLVVLYFHAFIKKKL